MDADADQMDKAGLEESALDEEEELYEELSDDLLDAIMEKLTQIWVLNWLAGLEDPQKIPSIRWKRNSLTVVAPTWKKN